MSTTCNARDAAIPATCPICHKTMMGSALALNNHSIICMESKNMDPGKVTPDLSVVPMKKLKTAQDHGKRKSDSTPASTKKMKVKEQRPIKTSAAANAKGAARPVKTAKKPAEKKLAKAKPRPSLTTNVKPNAKRSKFGGVVLANPKSKGGSKKSKKIGSGVGNSKVKGKSRGDVVKPKEKKFGGTVAANIKLPTKAQRKEIIGLDRKDKIEKPKMSPLKGKNLTIPTKASRKLIEDLPPRTITCPVCDIDLSGTEKENNDHAMCCLMKQRKGDT